MGIRTILDNTTRKYGDKKAMIFSGTEVTFSELHENVLKLASALREQGIAKGDKVGIFLPNCLEYAYSYLAVFCLGAVVVPLDFMLKNEEVIACFSHAEIKLIIAKDKPEIDWDIIKKGIPTLKKIILCHGKDHSTKETKTNFDSYDKLMINAGNNLPEVRITDSDPAMIMYTSGTTGAPKGILLNYKHLEGSPKAMEHFVDLTDKDIKLAAIPLSHIGGFIYVQNCIHFGITLVLMDRFNPFEFLENIVRYKVTCFHIVPPMYTAMLSVKQLEKFDLSSLRWVVVFGAPSSPEILERFHQYCPNARLLNGWGMTETCPPNTVTPLDSHKIESVGKPSPYVEIKIFDEKDRALPQGEIGEIVLKGWAVMDEYYKDPKATSEAKRNGWFHTGDLGRFDEEGFLYIVGRKKEMIKVGGQIVFAPEVELALTRHPAVAEAAVIGVEDKLRGEAVKAYVVLKSGAQITPEEIRYFCKDHLAKFKIPQVVEIKDELPKNRTGKIDKALLKDEAKV